MAIATREIVHILAHFIYELSRALPARCPSSDHELQKIMFRSMVVWWWHLPGRFAAGVMFLPGTFSFVEVPARI